MRAQFDGGFEIDTAHERLDVALVHRWISTDAYWAIDRPLGVMTAAIANSLCFGLYGPTGTQIGFARAVTDHATFAWLCDVYIVRGERGRGLGTWLAETATRYLLDLGVRRVLLATADAHAVYRRAGFEALPEPGRWMLARRDLGHT